MSDGDFYEETGGDTLTLLEMKKKVLGLIEELNAESEGYVVDVYKKHIVLRGRDFVSEKFLPIASYWLDTTLQTIEANTFTDSTGTIMT